MSITSDKLLQGFNKIITLAGTPVTVKYYTQTTGSIYDEPDALSLSGSVYTSGVVFSLDPRSSEDNLLLEQGKLAENDIKIYLSGGMVLSQTTGSVVQTKVIINNKSYSIIPLGANAQEVSSVPIYKLAYLRLLPGGSFYGE